MQIGNVIRRYRREKGMTQEEMANILGVTAPAVNKWENGVSMPDITLLAPIARLLDISLDTLLAFKEELTKEEIAAFVKKVDEIYKIALFEEAFHWIKDKIKEYPNCLELIWQLTTILDAQRMTRDISDSEKYDAYIIANYERVLKSEDEMLRSKAADSLFSYYIRNEEYERAEEYMKYFSYDSPERKRKQAMIYSNSGRNEEAYKAYEELLFSSYGELSLIFHGIYQIAMKENNLEKARQIVKKQEELARLFEMGKYHEVSCGLELAVVEKDKEKTLRIMEEMLDGVKEITQFKKSLLYEHMMFKEVSAEFVEDLKQKLVENFKDQETYGFLWEEK